MNISRVTRRRFLKLAAGAVVAAPVIIPRSAWGANDRINVAVIGNGNRGGDLLAALLGHGDARVVAVCDVDRPRRESTASKVRDKYGPDSTCDSYSDFRELLERKDIDAVAIGTPDHTHALIAIAAMKTGKDVYCEKPLSLTIAEGRAMAETARRYARVLQCGTQRRSDGAFRRMCELVVNGRIGRLKTVEIGVGMRPVKPQPWEPEPVPEGFDYDLWLGPAPWEPYTKDRCHYNFRFLRAYSGGDLTNMGAHAVDIAQWALGADESGPIEVEGEGEYHRTGLWDTFYKFRLEYKYACGVTLVCTSDSYGVKFIGTEGWIKEAKESSPPGLLKSVIRPGDIRLHESHGDHMQDFVWALRTRERTAAPAETGHRTTTVCNLGNIALTLERKLRWDPAKEEFAGDEMANQMRSRPYRAPWRL
ncbi:MAG: Gfo/Idh/MocA family oxidoreductase [Planctomycetota bacterium]|nr:Gfo/Idh/MocA family oxidoreductase [Planctomycetota bacterium]